MTAATVWVVAGAADEDDPALERSPGAGPLTVAAVLAALDEHDYLADADLATVVVLALGMHKPLLLEGEPGVGKTELAKVLSRWTGGRLVRLQCYEGIDSAQALYEWDYPRQLLHLRAVEAAVGAVGDVEHELYQPRFLLRRPLLEAVSHRPADGPPPVLLIDELDRADDEFEAFLLELLSDWTVTIPELGQVRAEVPPVVVITSNRTRDLHDALKRRCLYHWVEHPDPERELAILRRRVPGLDDPLGRTIAAAVANLRRLGLYKPPGVAEAIDWAGALTLLGRDVLDVAAAADTLGVVVKYREDQERVRSQPGGLAAVVAGPGADGRMDP